MNKINHEIVEKSIIFVAESLEHNVSRRDIQLSLAMTKDLSVDLELILIAGELLYKDRKTAPPKKTLIRRVNQ